MKKPCEFSQLCNVDDCDECDLKLCAECGAALPDHYKMALCHYCLEVENAE